MHHIIDLGDKKRVLDFEITPRWDAVPPAVGIVVETKTWKYLPIWSKTVAPPGARLEQLHAIVTQFSESATQATVSDIPDTGEGEEPTEEEIKNRSWNNQLKYETPEVITRGAPLPKNAAEFLEFVKRHDPNLKEANLIASDAALTKEPVPQNGAEGEGYSESATQFELVYGEIGDRSPGLKWGEVWLKTAVLHEGTPSADLMEYFPLPYQGGPNYWGPIGVKTITTNKRSYRHYPKAPWRDEEITEEEEEEEEEEAKKPDYIPPLTPTSYQSVVDGLYRSLQPLMLDGHVSILGVLVPDIGDTIQFINGEPEWEASTLTVIQTAEHNAETGHTKLTFGPPTHIRPTQNKDQQESYSEIAKETEEEEDDEQTDGTSWDTEAEYKSKQKMSMPGKGPKSEVFRGAFSPYMDAEFAIRIIYGLDGAPTGAQVKRGTVTVISRGHSKMAGEQEWNDVPLNSEIYCNIKTDKFGLIESAEFSDEPIENSPSKWEIGENGYPKAEQPPGSYPVYIGNTYPPKPYQRLGQINISYEPGSHISDTGPA